MPPALWHAPPAFLMVLVTWPWPLVPLVPFLNECQQLGSPG